MSSSFYIEVANGLFLFDVDLGYATVFHTLKLAEGGSATEAIATRRDTIMIEKIRLTLEVNSTAVVLRSVNGGGVEGPDGWDDAYEMFFSALEN